MAMTVMIWSLTGCRSEKGVSEKGVRHCEETVNAFTISSQCLTPFTDTFYISIIFSISIFFINTSKLSMQIMEKF